jgi:predicted metallopeptidase
MRWEKAPLVQVEVNRLARQLFAWSERERIIAFRSYGSKSRAWARIWGLPKIWQLALKIEPHYCLEIISEKFDRKSKEDQQRILIHELMHIPKNFSGSLLPHRGRGRAINRREVEKIFKKIKCC